MLAIKKEFLGKGVHITFDDGTGNTFGVNLDEATQEQLKLLKECKQDHVLTDKKDV